MTVQAKGYDGAGWYIVAVEPDGTRTLRHWTRFGLRSIALAVAAFNFANETTDVMYWDGTEWERS